MTLLCGEEIKLPSAMIGRRASRRCRAGFGKITLPSLAAAALFPPRKAVVSACASLRLVPRNITDIPRTCLPLCSPGAEAIFYCRLQFPRLQCMLSPPCHNRVRWRRIGMRYDLSTRDTIPVRARQSACCMTCFTSLVLTLYTWHCRQRGYLCLVPHQMHLQHL